MDEEGSKESVVLSFKEYQQFLEDLRDLAVIAERRKEPAGEEVAEYSIQVARSAARCDIKRRVRQDGNSGTGDE